MRSRARLNKFAVQKFIATCNSRRGELVNAFHSGSYYLRFTWQFFRSNSYLLTTDCGFFLGFDIEGQI